MSVLRTMLVLKLLVFESSFQRWLFFQKVRCVFWISKSQKTIQETILSLKFKFQAQDSFLEYFFLFEIWRSKKWIELSEKKPPLSTEVFKNSFQHVFQWFIYNGIIRSLVRYVFWTFVLCNVEDGGVSFRKLAAQAKWLIFLFF